MDISTIKATARVVEILHPVTNEPVGLRMALLPPTDPAVEKVRREITNKRLVAATTMSDWTYENQVGGDLDLLVASVSGWEWYEAEFHGEKPQFSEDTLRQVLKELPWVRDQVDVEAGKIKAFFPS